MKSRSVLHKQSVKKRKKRKSGFPVFSIIRRGVPVFIKGFLLLVIVAGLSLSLMYCYHYLLTSPSVKLEQVEVKGVDEEIKRELIDLCDLDPDQNLLFLDLDAVKKKMEEHPWIRSVNLKRRFPHTLFVQAELHSPSALVLRNGLHYMNQQCEVFKEVNASDAIDFPVITGVSKQEQEARVQLHRAARVMSVLKSQQGPWSLKELSEIHVQGEETTLYFGHLAAEIKVACAGLPDKIEGLRKLAKHLHKTGQIHQVSGIDLNSVDGAVVSFRAAS